MSETSKSVFLSYASPDAEPARRICHALCKEGVTVCFEDNELRAGERWDAKIRQQISECALFVPIVSAQSDALADGNFRLEWQLAAERLGRIAPGQVFLMPIVVDSLNSASARVPKEFQTVDWIRLPHGEGAWGLGERMLRLLGEHGTPETRLRENPSGSRPKPAKATAAVPAGSAQDASELTPAFSRSGLPQWASRAAAKIVGVGTWFKRRTGSSAPVDAPANDDRRAR